MIEYKLKLADVFVTLYSEQEILISERLEPFLYTGDEVFSDSEIRVQADAALSAVPEGGYWRGSTYYVFTGYEYRMFHSDKENGAPFAVTCIKNNGDILMQYRPEYSHYFKGSSGVFNRIGLETFLLFHNRILLHASFVKHEGKGILFSAPSGAGKSTQAELWRIHKNAQIINGDRAALGETTDGWTGWGIPYAGTSKIYRNEKAPIAVIVILKQASENKLKKLNKREAFSYLYPEMSVHHWEPSYVEKSVDLLQELVCHVPVYLLECLPDSSAVDMVYSLLGKEE